MRKDDSRLTDATALARSSSVVLPDGAFILSERARRHTWEGVGQLSIKTFPVGEAFYAVGAARYRLDSRAYLVLNDGQSYAIDIAASAPVESFCVFFAPGAAEDARRGLTSRAETLLDDPVGPRDAPVAFFERLYPHDDLVSPALAQARLALTHPATERAWLAERMRVLAVRLVAAQRRVWGEVNTLPAARASTREEIYRRLYHARDYATALLGEPLTLDELARVAAMSPTHFLRAFRQAFGQTPHQFLTARRIERARYLLQTTNRSVTDICYAVGFESLGSFSWLFRRRMGVSPTAYRSATAAAKSVATSPSSDSGDFGEA